MNANSVNRVFLPCPQCKGEDTLEVVSTGNDSALTKTANVTKLYQAISNAIVANCVSCGMELEGYELIDFLEDTLLYSEGE